MKDSIGTRTPMNKFWEVLLHSGPVSLVKIEKQAPKTNSFPPAISYYLPNGSVGSTLSFCTLSSAGFMVFFHLLVKAPGRIPCLE